MKRVFNWLRRLVDIQRQAEIHRLTLKAARRCTRDLAHAIDHIPDDDPSKPLYAERLKEWQAIFWDSDQYRDRLYQTILELEIEVERLRKLLNERGVDTKNPDVPF